SYTDSLSFTLPDGIFGDYYIFVHTDYRNEVFEYTYKANNLKRSAPVDISLSPYADLVVTSVKIADSVYAESDMEIEWQVLNQGQTAAVAEWIDRVYISSRPDWNPAIV